MYLTTRALVCTRAPVNPCTVAGEALRSLLPGQRPVVLLDSGTEAGRHFVRSGQRQLFLVLVVSLLAQSELEPLQLVERLRLQRQEVRRVDEVLLVVQPLQIANDLIELLRIDTCLAEALAQL